MSVLLLRLAGPMQSWGTQSRFTVRDTGREPSRSGVVGLLCAALGRPRSEPLDDLAALTMGVRVDREGTVMRDYHTAGGGTWKGHPYGVVTADGKTITWNNMDKHTVVSNRYYLADADFLVGLEGEFPLLERLDAALAAPVWPLFLGRKSFVPGRPVHVPDGLLREDRLEPALRRWRWLRRGPRDEAPDSLRLVLEDTAGRGEPRRDVPVSFEDRAFGMRYVTTDFVDKEEFTVEESPLCISPS